MAPSNVFELCNHCSSAINQMHAGGHVIVTQSGRPVADLRPLRRRSTDPATLLNRWRHLPYVDLDEMRRDLNEAINPTL